MSFLNSYLFGNFFFFSGDSFAGDGFLLKEDGSYLLQETGDRILL
jgi:hypothetical protein